MLSNEASSSGAYNDGSSKGTTWWISCVRSHWYWLLRAKPVCVFICFATKAIHLELIKDLSTVSSPHGLKRCICTRRRPRHIWSDNATNFVGDRNELLELRRLFLSSDHQRATLDFCLAEAIDWYFIHPRSPHFGGLWEATVKIAKHHFYRAVGTAVLAFEELRTLVCHISAIVSSRPLVSISEHQLIWMY